MKNYNANQALPIILKAAKEYDEKLKDKHLLIVYRGKNRVCTCCVGFRENCLLETSKWTPGEGRSRNLLYCRIYLDYCIITV